MASACQSEGEKEQTLNATYVLSVLLVLPQLKSLLFGGKKQTDRATKWLATTPTRQLLLLMVPESSRRMPLLFATFVLTAIYSPKE